MAYHVLCRFTNGNVGFLKVKACDNRSACRKASHKPCVLHVERVVI